MTKQLTLKKLVTVINDNDVNDILLRADDILFQACSNQENYHQHRQE